MGGTYEQAHAPGELLFESCERRLVLSAQLLLDVLGDHALEMHANSLAQPAMPVAEGSQLNAPDMAIDKHLAEAHAASGWNAMQQEFGLTGKGQTVAVIDSGIAWDHVALGQGYGPGYRVVGGWDFTEENDAQPYDDGPVGFHGTHVAGIIGSSHAVHRGVAPDVDLVALRVFNDMGQGQLSWVERALQWVHENRNSFENPITTVNLSLGTNWNADVIPSWATLEDEFQALYNDGIVVSASAGNSFQQYKSTGLSYPAASPWVLPVASVDDNGQISDFSQRSARVIAAPGSNIISSVPDHVLGRDGQIDDFTAASGTSMAAPYVAGASVLVRQAMEMVGYAGINLSSIADHLHATADSVFEPITGMTFDRLNLQRAIDDLIPDDTVGDTLNTAALVDVNTFDIDGWLNSLGDRDAFRFTAPVSGTLQIDADSAWVDSLHWQLQTTDGRSVLAGGLAPASASLIAGQSYVLHVSADNQIGSFSLDTVFTPQTATETPTNNPAGGGAAQVDLGRVDYLEKEVAGGSRLRVQAAHDGVFTIQWTDLQATSGSLSVTTPSGVGSDATWSQGQLRVDVNVAAGQWLDVRLPESPGGRLGDLALANVVSQAGSSVQVLGTVGQDDVALDLRHGLKIRFGEVEYAYPAGTIQQLRVDAHAGNDTLNIVGSQLSDKVDLRPGDSDIENSQIHVDIVSAEQITYSSGGGPDRVYLYDSDGDDTLNARPGSAELVGVGYRFEVREIDRIFIHATGGGQDYAYLYDSAGDDRLSVRPQFTSISGNGFFNYVRGFERVYAYASAGGYDVADLYDSAGNDRFSTSGASASIVGPGFSSFTRSFEAVNAHASSGGSDVAALYGSNQQTNWQRGSDFISFAEGELQREARGFAAVETFVAGQPHRLATQFEPAGDLVSLTSVVSDAAHSESTADAQVAPTIEKSWQAHQFATDQRFGDSQFPLAHSSSTLPTAATAAALTTELNLQQEIGQLADWLSHQLEEGESDEYERLELPELALLDDPELELSLLDKIFREHH